MAVSPHEKVNTDSRLTNRAIYRLQAPINKTMEKKAHFTMVTLLFISGQRDGDP